jgi:hypothetical protein
MDANIQWSGLPDLDWLLGQTLKLRQDLESQFNQPPIFLLRRDADRSRSYWDHQIREFRLRVANSDYAVEKFASSLRPDDQDFEAKLLDAITEIRTPIVLEALNITNFSMVTENPSALTPDFTAKRGEESVVVESKNLRAPLNAWALIPKLWGVLSRKDEWFASRHVVVGDCDSTTLTLSEREELHSLLMSLPQFAGDTLRSQLSTGKLITVTVQCDEGQTRCVKGVTIAELQETPMWIDPLARKASKHIEKALQQAATFAGPRTPLVVALRWDVPPEAWPLPANLDELLLSQIPQASNPNLQIVIFDDRD